MNIKVPPHSPEAERGVLGSVLIDSESLHRITDLVTAEDFYEPAHAVVFQGMVDLATKGKAIDLLTLREYLDDRQNLDKVGGPAYLVELTAATFSSANVFQYAQIVKAKSMLRRLIKIGNEITLFGYDEETEINKLLEKTEQCIFSVTQTFIQNRLVHIRDILNLRYEEFAEIHANPEYLKNGVINTDFKDLDGMIGGFKAGDMVVLAARPSMGKTALMLNMAQNMGVNGKNVAIFSLEMSKEQLTDRLISAAMGVDSWKLQKGQLSDEEFSRMGDALERLSRANIYIDDSPLGNLLEVKSKARRLKMESGLDCVMIDYLQLMGGGNPANRVQEISEISRGIKGLARELGVPIIALSQLSRAVESRQSKEPILSDLRESGSIEQDADSVLMLYREDYYEEVTDPERQGVITVFVQKNRNGPTGRVDLKFERKYQKFYNIDRQHFGAFGE